MVDETVIQRIFECLDKIDSKLEILANNDTRNTLTLEEHIRRTELLETKTEITDHRVEVLEVEIVKNRTIKSTAYKCVCIVGSVLATIASLIITWTKFK
jgi:hypothetical protein